MFSSEPYSGLIPMVEKRSSLYPTLRQSSTLVRKFVSALRTILVLLGPWVIFFPTHRPLAHTAFVKFPTIEFNIIKSRSAPTH